MPGGHWKSTRNTVDCDSCEKPPPSCSFSLALTGQRWSNALQLMIDRETWSMHNPGSAANAATDILGQDLSRTSLTNDYKAADNASAARSHHVKTRPPCASTPHRVSTDHAAPARRASQSCASLPRRYFGMAQGSLRSSSPPSTWGPRSNRRIYDQAGGH